MVDVLGVACRVLQFGHVLVRVQGHHTVVMVSGCDEHGWVPLFTHILQRRVFDEEIVGAFLVWVTVFSLPEVATGEMMETEHIGDGHLRDGTGEEVWSLVRTHGN